MRVVFFVASLVLDVKGLLLLKQRKVSPLQDERTALHASSKQASL